MHYLCFAFCSQIENDDEEYLGLHKNQDKKNKNRNKNKNKNKNKKQNNGKGKGKGKHKNKNRNKSKTGDWKNKVEIDDVEIKRKERILSDTENYTDNEYDEETNTRMSRFKQSLSIQIQKQEKLMDEVMNQMRRDSQHGLGLGLDDCHDIECKFDDDDDMKYNDNKLELNIVAEDLNKLKVKDTLKEEPEISETEDGESMIEPSLNKDEENKKILEEEGEFVVNA